MPLLRLHQEMETFHTRAVEDTTKTVDKLETMRSKYRASLLWMKDISERLNPDVYQQLDKFRRVQNQVRLDKKAFDNLQMDVVQKIDLLMASRCNLINQILGSYQSTLLETFEKNFNNFKSVEELIKKEDIYEYEFKALTQLNPMLTTSRGSNETEELSKDLFDLLGADETKDGNEVLINKEEVLIDLLAKSDEEDKPDDNLLFNDDDDDDGDAAFKRVGQITAADEQVLARCGTDIADNDNNNNLNNPNNEANLLDLLEDPDKNESRSDDLDKIFNKAKDKEKSISSGKTTTNKAADDDANALIDLLKSDLDDIDNSSYFKTLERLQL